MQNHLRPCRIATVTQYIINLNLRVAPAAPRRNVSKVPQHSEWMAKGWVLPTCVTISSSTLEVLNYAKYNSAVISLGDEETVTSNVNEGS